MAESISNDNNTCVVCFKNVVYFSIGECDHPVCFECSTRMRVLCQQNECPICRQVLARVVFTDTVQPYKELRNKSFSERLFEREYKIGFCSEEIKDAFEQLLINCCKQCTKLPPFRSFTMLSDHMRKAHERFFCDLCVKHLKIFTNERKCYTRQELAHHRRKGDLDDTSHRGHPLCEFCEERFMDADELYRHLRKEHLYCHLCDADGRNLYYPTHEALAHHFRTDHFLCEEGDCAGQHLTAVFRSDIDLKAHKATVHGRGMPRGATRQARTLELQFNITPHPVVQRTPRDRDRERDRERVEPESPSIPVSSPRIDTRSNEDFPRLSAAHPPSQPALLVSASTKAYRGAEGLARNDRNFPALDGAAPVPAATPRAPVSAAIVKNSKPSVSIQLHSQPASASNFRLTQTSGNRISIPAPRRPAPAGSLCDDDFPSLGPTLRDDHPSLGAQTLQPSKVTLVNNQEMSSLKSNQPTSQPKKPQLSSEAFPALSSVTAPAVPPKWITVPKNKEKTKGKTKTVATTPPKPREPVFNPVADFPTLPANNTKNKQKKTPQSQTQTQPQSRPTETPKSNKVVTVTNQFDASKSNSKKDKRKQDLKQEDFSDPYENGIDGRNIKDYLTSSININNNSTSADKKIKTIDCVTNTSETSRNEGNGDFSLATKDYPPLNPKSERLSNKKTPNGSVPPGFKPCNGMTFTNSSGQTFPAPVHTYIPPTDFEQRNRALVKRFAVALGSADAVDSFKVASRAFRDNILSADEFYRHCQSAMGSQVDNIFPELVALLPDIAKQQELVVGKDFGSQLDVCSTCGQLLAPNDKISHDTAHWPPLGAR